MKQAYKEFKFKQETLNLIAFMNDLIEGYARQGFSLSVRQVYYQLVAKDMIPNSEQSYKRIVSTLNDGRLAGLIDWDAIEDRNRDIVKRSAWGSGADILSAAASSFHMDMWDNQPARVFVIVEKAALAGVMNSVCSRNDVPLLAARGYPSVTVVREMVKDHLARAILNGQAPVVLHLGDHDPSGIDMTRDLQDRLGLFLEDACDASKLDRIALTMEQIREVKPPPNPAKVTDSRYDSYRRSYGSESWELDALEPSYLTRLVQSHIDKYRDVDLWNARRDEIETIRGRLHSVATSFGRKRRQRRK